MSISTPPSLARYRERLTETPTKTLFGYGLLLPASLLVFTIIIYPLLQGIYMSFNEVSFLNPAEMTWAGLENYREMLTDETLHQALWNTVLLTVVTVVAQYVLGLSLALLLKQSLPGMRWIRTAVLLAWITPLIVNVFLWQWASQPEYGLVNIVFGAIGLPTTYWLGDPNWALPMVMFQHVWSATPFFAVVFLAALQSIPSDIYRAAKMDGASSVQTFRYITLPHLSYVSMILIVLYTIAWFNAFTIIYVGTGGGPIGTTEVISTYIYKQGFQSLSLGYAAAVGLVDAVLLIIFTIVYVKLEARE